MGLIGRDECDGDLIVTVDKGPGKGEGAVNVTALVREITSLRQQLEGAVEALYSAHEFIKSVTRWAGQQDDQEEVLAQIEKALPDHPGGQ